MNANKNTQVPYAAGHRAQLIRESVSIAGFESVAHLARRFSVSEMTIRRDLEKLEAEGQIRRTHGGAIPELRTKIELDYQARQQRQAPEKAIVGKLAADLVENGQSVFIDAGTTTLAMARELKKRPNLTLTIISNSLLLQMERLESSKIQVILVGGSVLPQTMSLYGSLAQENISQMRFDWAFLGTGGIDIARGLTLSTMEEIPIKKAAAKSANRVAVLADHTKLGRNALSLFMSIDSVDIVITDKGSITPGAKIRRSRDIIPL